MNKCLKIMLIGSVTASFRKTLSKHAKKLKVEGTLQSFPENVIRIIVCGTERGC